jgi:cyclopropane-fatty-acyl-phospholipid synthase
MLLTQLLRRIVRSGLVILIDHKGNRHDIGIPDGRLPVTVRLHDGSVARDIFFNPRLAIGEAYMEGRLTVDDGRLYDFLDILMAGVGTREEDQPFGAVRRVAGRLLRMYQQRNPLGLARRNVQHHYDLSDALYSLFLDSDRQYSCAYFAEPGMTLEQAQTAKKRHIAAKLLLQPGQRVLDIGSGWGGLALELARQADVEVVGVTLSEEQHAVSRRRAVEAGLADRVRFELMDYREVTGRFDRIVSVGMFEHVGVPYYDAFFAKVAGLLTDDGVALLHSIGRMDGPGTTNAWLRKYIFPGGYSPALSEVVPIVEKRDLWITDIEILRLHYAKTLREWRRRFMANRDKARELYDERFCRMWEFYLTGCELSFRHGGQMVFQMQMAKRIDAVPLTRTYVYGEPAAAEQRLARAG